MQKTLRSMKRLLKFFNKIHKDKYQHFGVGALIASLTFVITSAMLNYDISWWLSLSATFILGLCKEITYDDVPDVEDFIATMLGWAIVGIPTFLVVFI